MTLEDELFEAVASPYENVARVRELLEKGANVNAKDSNGDTPLHKAACRGYARVARLLIEHGADVNARENVFGDSLCTLPLLLDTLMLPGYCWRVVQM